LQLSCKPTRMGKIERLAPMLDRVQGNGYRIAQALVEAALNLADETP